MRTGKFIPRIFFRCVTALLIFAAQRSSAQPFIDLLNYNAQFVHTSYKDSIGGTLAAFDQNLSAFVPVNINPHLLFIVKSSGERLKSTRTDYAKWSNELYSLALPLGLQFTSKNEKWKMLGMVIPRVSSGLRENFHSSMQLGGTALFTWVKSERFKLKFGLYYNKEFFGNFFVPLAGIDWKISDRWSMYGILPNNMRLECRAGKAVYFGAGYKNYQRSYAMMNLTAHDSIRAKESEVKLFLDFYLPAKLVLFVDAGYSLNYEFLDRPQAIPHGWYGTGDYFDGIYSKVNNGFVFTAGIAYRMRLDQPESPKIPDEDQVH